MAIDTVCGMEVDEKKARFSTVDNGKKYYFCSKNCYEKFQNNPLKYVNKKIIKSSEKDKLNLQNKDNVQKKIELKKEDINKNLIEEERPLAEKKKIKVKDNEFVINVKDYLRAKDIEILEVLSERKRDFEARIRIDTMLGKQEFYLMAKDKKTVSDNDFAVALQKAQSKKMLAAVMATGSLNKKGKEHLEQWGNLVKYEKLKF